MIHKQRRELLIIIEKYHSLLVKHGRVEHGLIVKKRRVERGSRETIATLVPINDVKID